MSKSSSIQFRLTPEERQYIVEIADYNMMSISEVVRSIVKEYLKKEGYYENRPSNC